MTPAIVLVALVADEPVALRTRPADEAPAQAELHRGDWLEVRGEVAGFLRVWDHRRERPGYVRPREVRTFAADDASADALATVVMFLRDAPGLESLGVGHAALYVKVAAPARFATAQAAAVLHALGVMADRLARRLSGAATGGAGAPGGPAADRTLAAQLAVVESYGVRFVARDEGRRTAFCYDGDAHARVLGLPAAGARERIGAALALTRAGCAEADRGPAARRAWNAGRLRVLEDLPLEAVPAHVAHGVRLRRAEALAARAWDEARTGRLEAAADAQVRATATLAAIDREELAPEDRGGHDAVAVRVAAGRWAGAAVPASGPDPAPRHRPVALTLGPGAPGETCVRLVPNPAAPSPPAATRVAAAPGPSLAPFAERCTYGLVWPASARWSPAGDTLALAVGTAEAWTELWIVRRGEAGWSIAVVPPAVAEPGVSAGYAELAGFVPGGGLLVVREAFARGRLERRFEVRSADGARVHKGASRPDLLVAFRRHAAPWWRGSSLALRGP